MRARALALVVAVWLGGCGFGEGEEKAGGAPQPATPHQGPPQHGAARQKNQPPDEHYREQDRAQHIDNATPILLKHSDPKEHHR